MRTFAALLSLGLLSSTALAGPKELDALAVQATSTDAKVAAAAMEKLRAAGQAGVDAMIRMWSTPIKSKDLRDRVKATLDSVGGQYDCHASQLYWHTELNSAIAEAKRTGKPILSLRMLGKLTEECSCANSRFFRTALYANKDISKELRDKYVLHWKSVRPVPVVTIDFGDGRVVKRTLTGNSIHYVLDSNGRVIDGLPGLYSPKLFLAYLKLYQPLAKGVAKYNDKQFKGTMRNWHANRQQLLLQNWQRDLNKVAAATKAAKTSTNASQKAEAIRQAVAKVQPNPNAVRAGVVARGKAAVELPIIYRIANWAENTKRKLRMSTNEMTWRAIANLHRKDVKLDRGSVALMLQHNPTAIAAAMVAPTKEAAELPILRVVRVFENNIALDTVRNEYLIHTQIHDWFRTNKAPTDLEKLNDEVYAKLFLTPKSDPWLGLVPSDVYTGIRNNGLISRSGK